MQVSPVPASDIVCPPVCARIPECSCVSSINLKMLINSLREDTEYLLDLGVNGMGQSNRTLSVVWLGRVNRYPYPRIKCIKVWEFEPGDASRDLFF
ncbi:hypothetical protein TNCV_3331301 [Trichonephila clavipes]|nr:hypothetical protein TNCV_3331301 [Trichonephila clavipes]